MAGSFAHIYIHIPFCDVICHYCDFYTARTKDARQQELFAALEKEAQLAHSNFSPQLQAIYFGGGTPSASPPALIHSFLDRLRSHISPQTEITLEANPNNITREAVKEWSAAGVNRLSLGIQSLNDTILRKLGRTHSAEKAREAIALCAEQFDNVTGDLIYGVPEQSSDEPAEHAMAMADLGVKHFSAYHLSLSEKHFLYPKLPDDQFAWQQIQKIHKSLATRGFRHYEISNFAQVGYESRNNTNYWTGGPYWALGPSAHGFDGEFRRWKNIADWQAYIALLQKDSSPREEEESLTTEQRMIECIFTGLRLESGLDLNALQQKFGVPLEERHSSTFALWKKMGLGEVTNGKFIPTFEGRMLADELAKKLI